MTVQVDTSTEGQLRAAVFAAVRRNLPMRAKAVTKHWRWMGGMLTLHGDRVVAGVADDLELAGPSGWSSIGADDLPDLDDPATLGAVFHMACEAWGPGHELSLHSDGSVSIETVGVPSTGWGYDDIVACLESAP